MSDAERLKAYGSIYTLSMTTTDDTDLQVHSIYDMINEAARQENLNEEVASRMTLIRYFYNYDLNDSLYAHAHEQMSFMRGHKLWDSYYELWSILVNGYAYNGMNNTALQEAQGMFQDAMTHNNNLGLGLAYYVMGNVYNNMNNTDEAINAYKESIRFTEKLDTLPLSAPDVYSYLGDVYAAQKKFSELRDLLVPWKKLLDTFEKEGKGRPENWAYYNLARVQADLGLNNLDDAEQLLENVLDSLPEGADFLHQSVLYYKAQLRLQQQRYLEALFLNTQRMQFMMDSDDKSVLIDVRRQRAEIMKHLGRFEEAAELYRQMYVINDSINTHDTKHQLAEMNAQFRVGQIEKEQAEAKMRNLIIIATIIVLSLVIFIYFRVRSARRLSKAFGDLEKTHGALEIAYTQLEAAKAEKERQAEVLFEKNKQLAVANSHIEELSRAKTELIQQIAHQQVKNKDDSVKYDIFISYSRTNLECVKTIKLELEQITGARCWMDLEGIESGVPRFTEAIINGIEQCEVFLFMRSEQSQNSKYSLLELNYAAEEAKKHVVIVNIDNSKMGKEFRFLYGLSDIIDWNVQVQREKLLKDIKRWT